MPTSIINLSLFGSVARGNHDDLSDLDVIAIVEDGSGKSSDDEIVDWAIQNHGKPASVSWYGRKKMEAFFESGDLFAWHLYLESIPLAGYEAIAFVFGQPAPFQMVNETIADLSDIFHSILRSLNASPRSVVFEAGIVYVCVRNIAMAASWKLCQQPDFSRNSPFAIRQVDFPLSRSEYNILARCRMAGQRGTNSPDLSRQLLVDWIRKLSPWVRNIRDEVS